MSEGKNYNRKNGPQHEEGKNTFQASNGSGHAKDQIRLAIPDRSNSKVGVRLKGYNKFGVISMAILATVAIVTCLVLLLHHFFSKDKNGRENLPSGMTSNVSEAIGLACAATQFTQLCQSSLDSVRESLQNIKDIPLSQNIVEEAIRLAAKEEQQGHNSARKLVLSSIGNGNLTKAANGCVFFLRKADNLFAKCQDVLFKQSTKQSIEHNTSTLFRGVLSEDVQAWMSAILTYVSGCQSGLQNLGLAHIIDREIQQVGYAVTLTSNALSMVDAYRLYGSDLSKWKRPQKRTLPLTQQSMKVATAPINPNHPLMRKKTFSPAVFVSRDGLGGSFTSIQSAVNAAPDNSTTLFVIHIKGGVYNETVTIPYTKTNIMFVGDGINRTVITGNKNVQMHGIATYESATVGKILSLFLPTYVPATVAVDGDGFIAQDITFENTAGPEGHQAVALRVNSDLSIFHRCAFLGHQDTLYVQALRQFYGNCEIRGTIDFIFGNAASIFQNCTILVRSGQLEAKKSVITAQGRTDPAQTTGLVFHECIVNGTEDFDSHPDQNLAYLGRPWKEYSRTIFMRTYLGPLITPEGWLEWNGTFALASLFYGEYMNLGPGAGITRRVSWSSQLSMPEALQYTVTSFIQGDQWIPLASVPFNKQL